MYNMYNIHIPYTIHIRYTKSIIEKGFISDTFQICICNKVRKQKCNLRNLLILSPLNTDTPKKGKNLTPIELS